MGFIKQQTSLGAAALYDPLFLGTTTVAGNRLTSSQVPTLMVQPVPKMHSEVPEVIPFRGADYHPIEIYRTPN